MYVCFPVLTLKAAWGRIWRSERWNTNEQTRRGCVHPSTSLQWAHSLLSLSLSLHLHLSLTQRINCVHDDIYTAVARRGVCVHACLCVCVCVCSPLIPLPTSVFSLLFLHFALCSSSLHLSFSRCVCSAQDAHLKGAHTHTHTPTHTGHYLCHFWRAKYKRSGFALLAQIWRAGCGSKHTLTNSYWTVAINCVYVCERKSSISAYILYSVGFMFH